MLDSFRAVFRDGAFVPQTPCGLPDNSEVELSLLGPSISHPANEDANVRAAILKQVTQRMRDNPLPVAASTLTRDSLHERR
jgi:hypothetical protein